MLDGKLWNTSAVGFDSYECTDKSSRLLSTATKACYYLGDGTYQLKPVACIIPPTRDGGYRIVGTHVKGIVGCAILI